MFCRTSAHFETLLVLNPKNGYFHTDMPLAWHSGRKERYVLFNDALDTFYLLLYLVKYHSDSKRGNLLPPHRLLFPFSGKGYFLYAPFHRQVSTYRGLCYTSCGALAGTKMAQWINHEKSIRWPIPSERTFYHGEANKTKFHSMKAMQTENICNIIMS